MANRIERSLLLDASPDEVWDAVTQGAWIAEDVVLDLQPGGDAIFRSGDEVRAGWIEEVAHPGGDDGTGRLSFWWAEGDEPASRVEVTVAPSGRDGTCVRVVETRPLDVFDVVGTPLPGLGGPSYGPALLAGVR